MSNKSVGKHFTLDRNSKIPVPEPKTEARAALDELRAMAYRAAVRMEEILKDSEIPDGAKLPVVNMVLDRVYGKPEEMLTLRSNERAVEESAERIRTIAERIRNRNVKTLEHSNNNTRISEEESKDINASGETGDQ